MLCVRLFAVYKMLGWIFFSAMILVSKGCESLQCTNSPVDLVFVIDSSSSIFPNEFVRQLEFLENITGELDVGPALNQSRVGVISFSDEPRLEIALDDYTKKKDILSAIRRINYLSGGTNTAAAIHLAVDKVFKLENGTRKEAKDIIVLITDGESFSESETKESALQARNMGINMFAIGVGANVNVKELRLITGIKEHVYQVSSYGDLQNIKDALINKTCIEIHQSTNTPILQEDMPPNDTIEIGKDCSGKPADVLFLLDSSSSISRNDFKKQLSFIKTIVSAFDINPHKTAVGVSTFSDHFQSVFHLNEFTTKESIVKAVGDVPYLRGGTDTGNALKNILDHGFEFARPDVAHILIVITDGLSRDPSETILQASRLKKSGVFIFAIGVGPFADKKELKAMASPPHQDLDFVFNVSTYDALNSIKNLLAIKTCVIAGLQMDDRPLCIMEKPVDILFAFNAATIGNHGTRSILKTIQNFEKLRFQNESDIRIGVISQSCAYGGDLPLQTPNKNLAVSFDKLSILIKRIKSYGITEENGARSESVHIVVLMVDNLLTREDELEILELETMVDKMYIAYVGNSHNKGSIVKISSFSVKTLSLTDFTATERLSEYLREEICQNVLN